MDQLLQSRTKLTSKFSMSARCECTCMSLNTQVPAGISTKVISDVVTVIRIT
jgi:hypothetical protein